MEFLDLFKTQTIHSWGFTVKLAEAANDETTSFKSAGAKVQFKY